MILTNPLRQRGRANPATKRARDGRRQRARIARDTNPCITLEIREILEGAVAFISLFFSSEKIWDTQRQEEKRDREGEIEPDSTCVSIRSVIVCPRAHDFNKPDVNGWPLPFVVKVSGRARRFLNIAS